nr:hypothetical protein Iba_chr01dCG6620 [Ipomoea batatas]
MAESIQVDQEAGAVRTSEQSYQLQHECYLEEEVRQRLSLAGPPSTLVVECAGTPFSGPTLAAECDGGVIDQLGGLRVE